MKTKTPQPPDTTWHAKGSKFDRLHPDSPHTGKSIRVQEKGMNVTMPTCTEPMGKPVDADLSIYFIQNYLNIVGTIAQKKQKFLDDSDKWGKNDFKDFINDLLKYNDSIFQLNYGMTLDKNLAFKILSQTGCEGLRFYLCVKKSSKALNERLSLVVVGVDCEGYDLNYPKNTCYTETGDKIKQDGKFTSQPNGSLPGEYVIPPHGQPIDHFFNNGPHDLPIIPTVEQDFANRFALLNLARKGLPVPKP